jgi:hypothetical protein
MEKIVKIAAGLAIGWIVEQMASNVPRKMGVPPHAAKVAGAVIGAAA